MNAPKQQTERLLEQVLGAQPRRRLDTLRRHSGAADDAQLTESLVTLADAAERLAIADLDRALAATGILMQTADEAGFPLARARARRARAQALAYANRFEEALAALHEAVELAESAGQPLEAARARLTSLHALARLGRYGEAVEAGERARAVFVERAQTMLSARADINLGVTHRMRDDPRAALAHFDRARPLVRDDPVLAAQLESNRAEALLDLHDFAGAQHAFEAALETFARHGMNRAAAIVEGNLADLMSRQGRLDIALRYFEQARRRLERDDAPGDVGRIEAEQAEALANVGMYPEARQMYRRAIPRLEQTGLAWELARARAGLGRALTRLGDTTGSLRLLEEAARNFEALAHATGAARTRLVQAEALLAESRPHEAARLLRSAEKQLRTRPADRAAANLLLARIALDLGNSAEAGEHIDLAMQLAKKLDLPPLLADALHERARWRQLLGNEAAALDDLRRAISHVERIRGTLQAERFRSAFLGDRASIFADCYAACLEQPQGAPEAFAVAEQARSRSLLDLVGGGISLADPGADRPRDESEAGLLAELSDTRAELNALYAELDAKPDTQRITSPAAPQWRRRLGETESRLRELESRLASTRTFSAIFGAPATLEQTQRCLAQRDALVQYFEHRGRCSAIVVTPSDATPVRGAASTEQLRQHAENLHFQINRAVARGMPAGGRAKQLAADAREELAALYTALVAPCEEALGPAENIRFVPTGPLHAVPFHALFDGERSLIERCAVSIVPSASLLVHLRAREPDTHARPDAAPLIVGVSDEDAPQAEQEAQEIAAALDNARLLTGKQATVEAVSGMAGDAALLHVSSHARFIERDPLSSGLRLADGWLTARDVYRLRLPDTAVSLSACESGRSIVEAGDELMGLPRAFLAAGASSLVMSLWPVHDQMTRRLMVNAFGMWYSQYDGAPPRLADAVRSAQIRLAEEGAHPAAWAAFACLNPS